ncbi:hypothetical protein ACFO4O_11835 [Glaciecola siphonariae]|uniref:Uncharacterized protein n=1 Tax=Glaciecola siphonariae TaxID=521012 RepID=A0ABV9LZR4_9ALTE
MRHIIYGLAGLSIFIVFACTENKQSEPLTPAQQAKWQHLSAQLFLTHSGTPNIEQVAEQLNLILSSTASQTPEAANTKENISETSFENTSALNKDTHRIFRQFTDLYNATQSSADAPRQESATSAKQERLLKQLKLYLAHIAFSPLENAEPIAEGPTTVIPAKAGTPTPVIPAQAGTPQTAPPQLTQHQNQLNTLTTNYPVLTQGEFALYEANNHQGLLAYSRTLGKQRAFIAYNLSYDVHDMPLPFGFMASTKVTLWRMGSDQAKSFVTDRAIVIRPFEVVVVLVGV